MPMHIPSKPPIIAKRSVTVNVSTRLYAAAFLNFNETWRISFLEWNQMLYWCWMKIVVFTYPSRSKSWNKREFLAIWDRVICALYSMDTHAGKQLHSAWNTEPIFSVRSFLWAAFKQTALAPPQTFVLLSPKKGKTIRTSLHSDELK